jgi:dihydroorotate dehydrogenase (fumarate)
MGIRVKNPIIAGSSGLTGNAASIKKLADAGVGAVVLKSLFEEEILREAALIQDAHMSHSKGNTEFFDYFDYEIKQNALKDYAALIAEAKSVADIPVIASINCTSNGEWASYAHKIEQAGANGIELNVMLLGSDMSLTPQKVENLHFDIIKNVLKHTSLPVSVKISPYFTAGASFFSRLSQTGVKGIVMFNRMAGFDFDINTRKYVSGNVYSAESDFSNTLRWISILSGNAKCQLTASSGIHSAETAIKMLMAGAENVQVTSSIYKNGIQHVSTLLSEITQWMKSKGYESIDEFKGCMSKKDGDNSDVFERVQFMKYFSDYNPAR